MPRTLQLKKHLVYQVLFLCLAGTFYFVLAWPGLQGGFVLDDWPNLRGLGKINSWPEIVSFSLSGASSNVGRPVSYFSFALQAADWSENPFAFKVVNAAIHFLNFVLLYGCTYLASALLGFNGVRRYFLAGITSLFWLMLPLNASAIFYVVQRMTLLAGTFTLMGVFAFLIGVYRELEGKQAASSRSYATVGVAVAYVLGILSKENAVMLGMFLLVSYIFLVRPRLSGVGAQKWWDLWVVLFAVMPLILTFAYLAWDGRYLSGYSIRNFTPVERLLTESRILWDYTLCILFPTPSGINFFNDGYVPSRGLFLPVSTFAAILGWILAFLVGWHYRKTFPCVLFAFAWFLGGHLLESTLLGLELYFEHRNYIPSIGYLFGGFWLLLALEQRLGAKGSRWLKMASVTGLMIYVGGSFFVFYEESVSWQDRESFTVTALQDRPNSLRANQETASYLTSIGDYRGATLLFYEMDRRWPDYPAHFAWLMVLNCLDSNVVLPDDNAIRHRFLNGKFERSVENAFYELYKLKQKSACSSMTWDEYRNWLDVLMKNPNRPRFGIKFNLLRLKVFSFVSEGDLKSALQVLDSLSYKAMNIEMYKLKAELLFMAGENDRLERLIDDVVERYGDDARVWAANEHYFSRIKNTMPNAR